jgi:hypothetical protein
MTGEHDRDDGHHEHFGYDPEYDPYRFDGPFPWWIPITIWIVIGVTVLIVTHTI